MRSWAVHFARIGGSCKFKIKRISPCRTEIISTCHERGAPFRFSFRVYPANVVVAAIPLHSCFLQQMECERLLPNASFSHLVTAPIFSLKIVRDALLRRSRGWSQAKTFLMEGLISMQSKRLDAWQHKAGVTPPNLLKRYTYPLVLF